jgi:hypothetical protein
MATTLAPGLSVTSDDNITDVTVSVIFSPCQPLGATTVIVEPDAGTDHAGLLALAADVERTTEHTCALSASGWCLLCGADARALPASEHTF